MKCKHENADHLMPGDAFYPPGVPMGGETIVECEQFRCIDCGAWLPLGPSTDTGPHAEAVAIEIRAAEIQFDLESFGCDSDGSIIDCEGCGWATAYGPYSAPASPAQRAGYLANCIATHTDGEP